MLNIFKPYDWKLVYYNVQDYPITYFGDQQPTIESAVYLLLYSESRERAKIIRQGYCPKNSMGCPGRIKCLDKVKELGYTMKY
jgi:hypothetical protein